METKLKWNVFYHDINKQKITTFNIFDHCKFEEYTQEILKKIQDKDIFAENLRRGLSYYFRSKCEYEVIVKPWAGGRGHEDIKVDIYTQVRNNWGVFVDYVWNSKKRRNENAGRGYVKKTGKCPMCEDCPDNCPIF